MDDLVLDASAAGKLFRREPESDALQAFVQAAHEGGAQFLAPAIYEHEIVNLVAKTVQEGALDLAAARSHAHHLVALVDLLRIPHDASIRAAITHKLTSYDAQYVVCAQAGARLVTYDQRLAKAAKRAGIQIVQP